MSSWTRISGLVVAAGALAGAVASQAQETATWNGSGGDLLYSNGANWDGGVVPLNGGTTYNVVIPGGDSVVFDINSPGTVDALDLGSGSDLSIESGRVLSVLGFANVGGLISATGAGTEFQGAGVGSTLEAGAQLQAGGGATVAHAATSFAYSGSLPSSATILSADGAGSLVDVSSLQSYVDDRSLGGVGVRTIVASNGGTVDLSGLETAVGANGNDTLSFDQLSGGTLLLTSLADVEGIHRFSLDAGETLSLPSLVSTDRTVLDLGVGSTFQAPLLSVFTTANVELDPAASFVTGPLTDIDGTRIAITGGLAFASVVAATYDYTGTGLPASAVLFSADGSGSVLDLSTLDTLIDDRNLGGAGTRTVTATNGGVVDLSNVLTVEGGNFDDLLSFDYTVSGSLLLDNLTTVSGRTRFSLEPGVSVTLPNLESLSQGFFDVPAGASFSAPNLTTYQSSDIILDAGTGITTGPLTNIDGSRVAISGGLSYSDIVATGYDYSGTGLSANATLFSADGAGSLLDLSSLESLIDDRNLGGAGTRNITATNGGTVDLSSVGTVEGGGFDDMLSFDFTSDGTIHLGSVATTTGRTRLALESGVSLTLPNLVSMDEGFFSLPTGSSLDLPVLTAFTSSDLFLDPDVPLTTGLLSNIDGTRVAISGGLDYTDIVASSYEYVGTGLSGNAVLLSADGVGSRLDLTSMTDLVDGRNLGGAGVRSIQATNGGTVDLSGVTTVEGGSFDDLLSFDFEPGSSLLIDNLTTVTGRTRFSLQPGVDLDLPLLTSVSQGFFDLPVGSSFDAPNLVSITSTDLILDPTVPLTTGLLANIDGSRITIGGGLEYSQVVADAYRFEGTNLSANTTILAVDGSGSLFDLSSLDRLIDDRNLGGAGTRTVLASNGGRLDLSRVELIEGGGFDDRLLLRATTGGEIDLGLLGGITRSGGVTQNIAFESVDPGSRIEVGNLALVEGEGTLLLDLEGALHVNEGFVFTHTNEGDVVADAGRFVFADGGYPGRTVLEVGGADLGLGGATSGNFGIGQLVVGTATESVILNLVDWKDNGNRSGGSESLYLYGLGSEDGLRVLGGSTLIIPVDMNVYARLGGVDTDLRDLFPEGETTVAFDDGFLQLGDDTSGVGDAEDDESGNGATVRFSVSPSPTQGVSQIRFGLAEAGPASVSLYDVRGRLVRTLLRATHLAPGAHSATWDGRNDRGEAVSSGIYFVHMRTDGDQQIRRLVVIP